MSVVIGQSDYIGRFWFHDTHLHVNHSLKTALMQISARLDCVENLTRQRHDRDQTENQQNAATVDSCFELVGSRQHGVAQQKLEQPARAEWSTKCTW